MGEFWILMRHLERLKRRQALLKKNIFAHVSLRDQKN